MKIDSQRLGFKLESLDQRYSRRVQENLSASRETFCDLETPGWTSLMRSQISERTKRNAVEKQAMNLKETNIYNKLNELQKLDWSEQDQKKMVKPKVYDKNQTRDSDQQRKTNRQSQQKSRKQKVDQSPKRWNQISVHDHLYQNSHKLQNKRMIRKILDEEFKRKQIFKFTPTINKKSIILAQSKFSRAKQNQQLICEDKAQNTLQTEATEVKGKQDRDVERYRILNRSFYFLSEDKALLTQKQLCNTAIQIPLPCLKVIQPLVSRVYQGQKMQWLDFMQGFNDKSIKGKEGFYTIMQKWFARNDEKKVCQNYQKMSTDRLKE